MWDELGKKFGLKPFLAGNTGVQMGGWFNKIIDTVDDFQQLRIRMPGLGKKVLERIGAQPISLPSSKIFSAIRSNKLDATEWFGPWFDREFGLQKVTKYYYYPGWHEPGPTLECIINKDAYEKLPNDLKHIVDLSCKAANIDMLADYTSKNNQALLYLISENISINEFPKKVMQFLKKLSIEVVNEIGETDAITKEVHASYKKFQKQVTPWTKLSEKSYLDFRE